MRTPRRTRAVTTALATALTAVLAGSVLVAAPASAATAWDPYDEGLQNSNESLGYPTFTNGATAIPPTTATYDPTVSHLGKIYAADLAAGAGSAPGKDFWLDRMLSRDGVQPDEAGGLDFVSDQPANIDYDNNGVFFSGGRAVYMQNSDAGLGFRGRIAYIEDLGQSGSTLTASVNGAAVSLQENQAKRHNTPSYWYSEYTGGGLLVKQTKFISRQNVAVERLQISTTDGSTKTVALRAESGLARTATGSELTGSVTTAHNVTQVATRFSGDGFGVDGTALTRTVSASAAPADVKLQLGFTTTEIPESTTEFQSIAAAKPAAAFTTQTTSYNTWWVENIPYLETPSGEIDKTLFYRWWLLRTNFLDAQVPGNDYQFPTSMEGVFGQAYNNAIVLTAGMFIEDMKYFRDPSSAYGTWLSAGETARESRYIDNPGNPNNWNSSYTNYISEAAWNSYALHGGDAAIADKLATYAEDDIAGQLAEFDTNKNNLLEYSNPALTGNDVDAVSFSWRNRDAWNSYPMDRPESAYLYSGAVAAAEAYRLAGDTAGADRMTAKAEAIKKSVLDVLWEDKRSTADEAGFFGNMIKASYSDGSSGLPAGSKIPWKEVNMYYPYTVGLMPKPGDADFDQKYLDAFRLFVDSEQYAPFPFYTANQKDAKARALRDAGSGKHYSNNFSTINSTVMFRLLSSTLRDYPNSYLTSDYYKKMLYWNAWASYEKGDVTRQNENEFWSHGSAADGGSIKYRSWIHQTQLGTTNFTVVEDAMGLQARTDSVLELSPIDIDWDHFTANNLKYHDKDLTIVWDEPGGTRHYGDTPEGYSVYLDGERAFTIDSLVPVEFDTVTGEVTTDATVLFSAANAVKPAQDVRFASTDRVVDLLGKAGVDIDPTTSAAPDLAQGRTATASYSASGSTPSGKSLVPANAVDGSTVNEPFWGTAGSPNASDWLEIDLGSAQKVNQAGIYFYRTSSGTTVQGYSAPKSYSVQYWDGTAWKSVTAQARTPKVPTGNENTVRFADVTTQKIRVLVSHQQGQKTGIKEVQLKNVAAAYTPAENAAPVVSIQRLAVADPSIARFVGTASDDGLPIGELTQAWTVVAKPADSTATFTDAASAATTVRFSKPGSYTLRFTASDTVKQTTFEQVVEVSDVRPLGPEVGSYATPSASYVAPWNRLASINDGETVPGVQTEQTKLWGTYADGARPASQTLTYTWSTPTRLAGAGASFWNDAAQGSGGGVALPASWSLEYLDGTTWKPVALRPGTQYPVNAMGTPSEVAFTPVTTTQLRATFQASRSTSGAHSAIGASEFDVYADYPGSFEAVAKRTTVNTPVTLPATVVGVYSDGSRGELRATWDAIPASRFATPGTITATGVLTGSTQAVTATISVGDSGSEIASIEQQTATTALGTAPVLPRTAVAVFSGGTGAKESRAVTWDAVAPASYATAGTFTVLGAMAGTTLRPSVTVTVEGGAATAPKAPAAPTVVVAGDAATVSWTAPADGGAAITGYTATVTPAGGAALTKTGTTTSAVFAALPAGTYTASVVATNSVGTSAVSPTASFTIAAAPALKVTASASSRCISGKVVLTVTAKNEEATPMGITLRTAYGTKVFTGVKPGSSATQAFTTRLGSIPAGTATVDATATVNGTALSRTVEAPYTARTC